VTTCLENGEMSGNFTHAKEMSEITVQHGSADTVVRAMSIKYMKWRLYGPVTLKPFNRFP